MNVIVCFWTIGGKVLYQSVSDSLVKNGNKVLYLDLYEHIDFSEWGTTYTLKNEKILLQKILEFNPDLVLSYNNVFPQEFVKKLSCPVCVIDADTPEFGFWNKEKLKENKDLFVFLGLQFVSKSFYERSFGKIEKYLYLPLATNIKREKHEIKNNIVFIGTNFLESRYLFSNFNFECNDNLFEDILSVYKKLPNKFITSYEDFKKNYLNTGNASYDRKIFNYFFYNTLSGMDRILHLSVLSDLGLCIYGHGLRSWKNLLYFDIDLAKCFNPKDVCTFESNSYEYNTAKIAVNISHKQAQSSFSWRVMDIMASNACLLTEDKPDWRDLFAKYLSEETLNTVLYTDRFDMREKAKRLLADENLRLRCVSELNNAIEQNGRWEHRFAELQKFLGITLINPAEKGELFFINTEKLYPCQNEKSARKGRNAMSWKNKIRYKLWKYLDKKLRKKGIIP